MMIFSCILISCLLILTLLIMLIAHTDITQIDGTDCDTSNTIRRPFNDIVHSTSTYITQIDSTDTDTSASTRRSSRQRNEWVGATKVWINSCLANDKSKDLTHPVVYPFFCTLYLLLSSIHVNM